jgi:hypothetical protein
VLVVDGDPGLTPVASEVYYLERALAPWGRSAALEGSVLPEVTSPDGLDALDSATHRVIFLANVADPGLWANRLVEFVNQGGSMVISLGDNVSADRTNGVLASLLPTSLRRPRVLVGPEEAGIPTQLPDVDEPIFAPFARGGHIEFGRIRWNQIFTVAPYEETEEVRTLLRLEGGLPLLIERRVGDGRVLLFTGTFDADWGNLPLQATFMPMIQSMVRILGVPGHDTGAMRDGVVGQSMEANIPGSLAEVSVVGPSGPIPAEVEGGAVRFRPMEAGAHRVVVPGMPPLVQIAVNVDPVESDVRRGASLAETAADVDPDRFMVRVPLHRWALWMALVFALFQALLALRRRQPEEPVHVS